MSKTTNSIVFILLATVVNIVLMIALFFVCIFIGSQLFDLNDVNSNLGPIVLGGSVIIAMGGTLFIYSKLMKWATVKFKLDEKLSPLFKRKRK
ncbi:MAG: leader peptide processing enzyme [Sphaerochaeta sp.]|jgi:hypothetical protein